MNQMIAVKTAELIGPALDWAVAQAEGQDMALLTPVDGRVQICGMWSRNCTFAPSTDWSQGGPLIGRHRMSFEDGVTDFYAVCAGGEGYGPTHLVAACRAIVSAALGDTAQVPSELIGGAQ